MADIVTKEKRSLMMSGIRGKNTKPELQIRKGLHREGFRFRLHDPKLPGKPDIVFPKYKAVILVHGCFWHGHDCHLFKMPSTRKEFWRTKFARNQEKDRENIEGLQEAGVRIGIVWECAIKGKHKIPLEDIISICSNWLRSDDKRNGNLVINETGVSFTVF